MSLENAINEAIALKMGDGTVERLVAENLEKGINKALESLFGGYGDVTKIIEKKIKESMVDQIERFDYSAYVAKLDHVLIEILKRTSLDHKKILSNFKEFMIETDFPKVVKVSDIFEEFKKHVAKEVDTSKLEVVFDDGVNYEHVRITLEVEREEERSWSSFEKVKVVFECEKDEDLNVSFHLSKFREYPWNVELDIETSISSLRRLDDFKIYLLKLKQSVVDIEIDIENDEDVAYPDAQPEASFC